VSAGDEPPRQLPAGGAASTRRSILPVMIVMTPGAGQAEVEAVRERLATTGVHVVVMPGELTTAIGAIGDPEGVRELGLEGMAGVDRVVPISRPYKLASSELFHQGPTAFALAGRRIGGGDTFCLIAGPCTVETRDPSHASGDRRLVEPLSRAAAAVGADGIIVEVHDHPEAALCDGPQSLGTGSFADYVAGVAAHARLVGKELA
jgi:hypothetical protein